MGTVPDLSDKLTIINQALINTSNEPVATPDDASDEWRVGNSAWEQCVPEIIAARDWNFATRVQELTRLGDSDLYEWNDIFAKPADSLFLVDIWRPDQAQLVTAYNTFAYITNMGMTSDRNPPALDYRIIGDKIYTHAENGCTCIYIPYPVGAQSWPPGFREALRFKMEAKIYQGLNGDMQSAMAMAKLAENALRDAASRVDQEQPRRIGLRSGIVEARWRGRGGRW